MATNQDYNLIETTISQFQPYYDEIITADGVIDYMGEIYEGKHEPLITKDLFDRTQEAFRKDNKPKHMIAKNFLFAGMVKCSKCGAIFQVKLKRVNIFTILFIIYIYYSIICQ